MEKFKKEGVIFDVDGVLISSLDNMENTWKKVCDKYMVNIDFLDYKQHIGKPFDIIMKELGLERFLPEIKEDYFNISKISEIRPKLYPGVKNVLDYLSDANFKIGIITSKAKNSLDKILSENNIGGYFDLVLTPPEDHSLGKPNPYLAEKFLENTNLNKEEIIYIGDMHSDKEFAQNAGIDYIHHANGYTGEMSGVKNIYSISEIINIIEKK